MKNIVSALIIVFSLFAVHISNAQIIEKQANKKQLIKGKHLVSNKQKLSLQKVNPTNVKVNKIEVIAQKNKKKKNIRKNKYNSKSLTKNPKRENE